MKAFINYFLNKFRDRLSRMIVGRPVYADQVCIKGSRRVVFPGGRVTIASPSEDAFVLVSSHYRLGSFVRNDVYAVEIPKTFVSVGGGLICDRTLRLVAEQGFETRHDSYAMCLNFREFTFGTMSGCYSMINHPYAKNFGHWMIDCLPRAITLEMAYPTRPIVFLMPEDASEFQRETLNIVLPPHFTVKYLEPDLWVRPEKLFWASAASGVENYMLPPLYFQSIRSRIFARYGLPAVHPMTRRIYVSRRRAKCRRITNEDALAQLLSKYGFEDIELETLSFRKQVELFHSCEVLVAPHGAGISTSFFSGPIHMLILYSSQSPPNYFHTQAMGLDQKHSYICGGADSEDADFVVNLDEVRQKLEEILNQVCSTSRQDGPIGAEANLR